MLLAAGDAAALLAFVLIGVMTHHETLVGTGLVRTAVPILAAWFLAAALFGTYVRPGWRTVLPTWAVGVAGGVALRRVLYGRPTDLSDFFTFLGVALAFTLAFVTAWRLVARRLLGPSKRIDRRGVG